ncbi:MAG: TetR/AcrR family transcriptional regulator [Thermomicrobiales bacterium]
MNAIEGVERGPVGGATARREQNRREMRLAILDAARAIVDAQGADKLTLRGIAQRLGYSAGAMYDYFPSKEHILHALYFLGTDGLGQHLATTVEALPPDTPTIDAIAALARTYRAYAHAHVELYWLAFSGLKARPVSDDCDLEEQQFSTGGFLPLLTLIDAGIANGTLIDTVEPMAIAAAAWSGVHGFVSLELGGHLSPQVFTGQPWPEDAAGDDQTIRDDLFETLIRTLLYGFVRRPTP